MKWLQKILEPKVPIYTGKHTPLFLKGKTQRDLDEDYGLHSLGVIPREIEIATGSPTALSSGNRLVPCRGTVLKIDEQEVRGVTRVEIVLDASELTSLKIYRNCRDNPFEDDNRFKIDRDKDEIASVCDEYNFSGTISLDNLTAISQPKIDLDPAVWDAFDKLLDKPLLIGESRC